MDNQDYNQKLIRIFAEESQEFIVELDKNFEFLDSGHDPDMLYPILNEVFRIVHSLKASTGTLGYSNMTAFLHSLETGLEKIKSMKIIINEEIINNLFSATADLKDDVSHLIENLKDVEDKTDSDAMQAVKNILKMFDDDSSISMVDKPKLNSKREVKYLQIILRLDPSILQTGTDPLFLIEELRGCGEIINISCNSEMVPEIKELIYDNLYLSWEVILKTELSLEEISEVFMFIKGKSGIVIFDVSSRYTEDGHEKIDADKRIGDILIERGKVDQKTVTEVMGSKKMLGEALVDNKKVSPSDLKKALADQEHARKSVPTTVRVDINKLDSLVNLIGELIINESRLRTLAEDIPEANLKRSLISQCEETSRIVNELQHQAMNTRMVPVDSIFSQFHRMVRDLSKKQGKNIRLILTGQETELDKNIIEKINNPLKHLVRNSIDHGIEMPDERQSKSKNSEAIVHLKSYQKEGSIFIEIMDDGKGLDKDAIYKKAIEKGILQKDEEISDDQIYHLVFNPGFSTAQVVTDVSGRGVGMDVVKKAIAELRGSVNIETEAGKGTSFIIRLPLTLAIIEGLLFKVGNEIFIMPLLSVNETFRPEKAQLRTIEGRGEYVDVRNRPNALIRLNRLFKIKEGINDPTEGIILNINVDHKKYSLLVDEIIGQQQVVLKSLEENYDKTPGFSGATILGDGSIAAIIDPNEIVQIYKKSTVGESVLVFHNT